MTPWAVRAPALVLVIGLAATVLAAYGATLIEPEVDFVDTVPAHPGLEPYRHLVDRLDGVRFVAVYQAHDTAFGPNLRTAEGFDALVEEQGLFTSELLAAFPNGTFSHQLSGHEAMKAGNYMLEKIATAGNPRPESYSVPEDPVRYQTVRDQALGDDTLDDVLAADGSSALMLFFFATKDPIEARQLTGEVAEFISQWESERSNHPATRDHQPSGLLWASHATDTINQREMVRLAPWAAAGVALALLWVVRRPANVLIATTSLVAALVWTYGIMGFAGIKISFLTMFLAPVVVGVGIDYAVHVLHRYEEERDLGTPRNAALSTAVQRTGRSVGIAATTTVAGMLVLLFVPNPLFAEIGGVAALGIALGFLAAITITPALRAVLPDGKRHVRRDRVGGALAKLVGATGRRPWIPALVALLLTAGAAWAATGTVVESGSAENEFPQDDPIILLQHRIEEEYGAFQRAYLVLEGDIAQPATLQAMHAAIERAGTLPLFREATSVTAILLADEATDDGAVDILESVVSGPTGQTQSDAERLPQSDAEAQAALDRLFADPLWRTIAPFTITPAYDLAIVSITIEPWADQDELRAFVTALQDQAAILADDVDDDVRVAAAGAPVNRAELVEQTPWNVAIATIGAALAVLAVLAIAWRRRGWLGVRVAAVGAAVVLASAVWLLAAIVGLDGLYGITGSQNNAVLSDMFLLAFAVTIAVGIDDMVHLAGRYWEEKDRGNSDPRDAALRTAGRAITGTSLTTMVAFLIMADVYFLQSKNLAILSALGVLFAYVLTLLLAPLALPRSKPL